MSVLRPFVLGTVATGALALFAAGSQAQDQENPGDKIIDYFLQREAAKFNDRFLDGANTLPEWEARRSRLRNEYLDMLGLAPLPEKTPLHATVTGTLEHEGVAIEKLHFQSRPGLYVTGNLYRPKTVNGKLPTILYVCGHSGRGRDGNKTAFQDHGLWFANHGYVCLIIDTLQLGEIPGVHHGTYREGRWWWQALGYTPAGVECWNGIRALDYLVTRPEVDPERLGVTGISGGGASTFWIAAADERVRCAVPVSGMSDLHSYVSNKVINGHCDCMFLVNTYQWEWTTIAALVAPRPLLFCNSDHDSIFPMDGNRRIAERLQELYKLYNNPDLFSAYVSRGGHDYRPDLRIAIFKWFNKHLKNDSSTVKDADYQTLPGKDLRVFPDDKDLPKDSVNGRIDEQFVPRAKVALPEAGKFEDWKKTLVERIRTQSFRAMPSEGRAEDVAFGGEVAGRGANFKIEPEPYLPVRLHVSTRGMREPQLLVVDLPEEAAQKKWSAQIFLYYALATRGVEEPWTEKSPPNYVKRAHALLGRTVDQGRVWDIISTIRYVNAKSQKEQDWRVVGRGQAGILAAYAALFEPRITEVIVYDPPVSHREGPIFLNILRTIDIPEALGLLAPRSLTLVNAKDPAFDRTVEIYKRAGAEGKLTRK